MASRACCNNSPKSCLSVIAFPPELLLAELDVIRGGFTLTCEGCEVLRRVCSTRRTFERWRGFADLAWLPRIVAREPRGNFVLHHHVLAALAEERSKLVGRQAGEILQLLRGGYGAAIVLDGRLR